MIEVVSAASYIGRQRLLAKPLRNAAPDLRKLKGRLLLSMNNAPEAKKCLRFSCEKSHRLIRQEAGIHLKVAVELRRANNKDPMLSNSAANLAVKLLRTYTSQMETLAKYRRRGEQTVRVEHVHVHSGGQAMVGIINTGKGGEGLIQIQRNKLMHRDNLINRSNVVRRRAQGCRANLQK